MSHDAIHRRLRSPPSHGQVSTLKPRAVVYPWHILLIVWLLDVDFGVVQSASFLKCRALLYPCSMPSRATSLCQYVEPREVVPYLANNLGSDLSNVVDVDTELSFRGAATVFVFTFQNQV